MSDTPLPNFVNRLHDREAVARFLDGEAPADLVITGEKGVGKTDFGGMLAHWFKDRFPDGVVFADLSDDPETVMRSILHGRFGIELDALESDMELLTLQYQWVTRRKTLLVIVDNAPSREAASAFRPVPGRSAWLVLAREWPGHGAVARHHLDPLPPEHAVELIQRCFPGISLDTASAIVEECGGNPEVLRTAAGYYAIMLEADEAQIARAGARTGEDAASRRDDTRRLLSESASWLYGLLLQLRGREFEVEMLAAIDGEAEFHLGDLVKAQLAEFVPSSPGRFRVIGDAPEGELPLGYRRDMPVLMAWYTGRAQMADRSVNAERLRRGTMLDPVGKPFKEAGSGLEWLRENRQTLEGLVRLASTMDLGVEAWVLAEAMWPMYNTSPLPLAAIATYRTALGATRDQIARARTCIFLGRKLLDVEQYDEARELLDEAVRLARERGDERMHIAADEQAAWMHYWQGDRAAAQSICMSGSERARKLGLQRSQALFLKLLGFVHRDLGAEGAARDCFTTVLELSAERSRDALTAAFELAMLGSEAEKAGEAIEGLREGGFTWQAAESADRLGVRLGGDEGRRWREYARELISEFRDPDRGGSPERV
ncbi:ATP-binding protein [Glycomyces sp. NPDC046736]|uniref:ATP-binding protein n=1 Tax=Glycomyces sp. NPDC046736 TaxID=3155615 RepID=UPI0033F38228